MEMGAIIKSLRLSKGYTQEELGAKIGVKKAAIQKYENGTVENLKRSIIAKLANALEVSPAYLMGWEEIDTKSDDNIYYLDEGDKFMSKYPPEARAELEVFLNYLDHKYKINRGD